MEEEAEKKLIKPTVFDKNNYLIKYNTFGFLQDSEEELEQVEEEET